MEIQNPSTSPMKQPLSYSRIENELLPKFRKQISQAESTEDLKRFFSQNLQELLGQVFAGQIDIGDDDVKLTPENEPPFEINARIRSSEAFPPVWNTSDLPNIIGRFSEAAMHRHLHLAKNLKKTEAKIRM